MSPAAFRLHSLATAVSAVRGRPGFVPDEYMAGLTEADLDHPGIDPVFLAAELCATGTWEPVAGGYRVLDAEAVQVCADRVRELREEAARRADRAGPGPSARTGPPAAGPAGTARFGDRLRQGTAASFRCGQCGEVAGVVRVDRAGSTGGTAGTGQPPAGEPACGWVILDCLLGTSRHAQAPAVLDGVQALMERGRVDPAALREISWALWLITPFYCPECGLNYCSDDWDTWAEFNPGSYDCILGTCPNGHRHLVALPSSADVNNSAACSRDPRRSAHARAAGTTGRRHHVRNTEGGALAFSATGPLLAGKQVLDPAATITAARCTSKDPVHYGACRDGSNHAYRRLRSAADNKITQSGRAQIVRFGVP